MGMLHCALEPLFGALEPSTISSITQYLFLQLVPRVGAMIQPLYVRGGELNLYRVGRNKMRWAALRT